MLSAKLLKFSTFILDHFSAREALDAKGQLISKANCQAKNSSKKRTNEFNFTTMRLVFARFLEEIEDTKKTFRNYLTFITVNVINFFVKMSQMQVFYTKSCKSAAFCFETKLKVFPKITLIFPMAISDC